MKKRSTSISKANTPKNHRFLSLKGHPFVVPVATFMTLFFFSMVGFIIFGGGTTVGPTDSHVVNVYIDREKQTLPTRASTVGDLLERLNITVDEEDVVEPALDSPILTDNFNINIYRARPVVIVDKDKQIVVNTPDQSPRIAARNAGIVVYPEDEVFPEVPEDLLAEGVIGERYVIDRATPLTLILYGSVSGTRTQAETVGELLEERGIKVAEKDTLEPSRDTLLTDDMKVSITREGQKVATIEEAIAPPIEYVDDPNLTRGSEVVKESGKEGKKVVTYDIKLENGEEVERIKLQEIVTVKPQRRLVARGTKIIISNPSENVKIGERMAAERGWTGEQFYCLYQLWQKESKWNALARNSSSGAFGIPQGLPYPGRVFPPGYFEGDPVAQISWGLNYIAGSSYGSPCAAWATSQAQGWY